MERFISTIYIHAISEIIQFKYTVLLKYLDRTIAYKNHIQTTKLLDTAFPFLLEKSNS